jgi:hypothetical protein
MDEKFGEWYRKVNLEPDDNLLKRRWKGISSFSKDITKSRILDLARIFYKRTPINAEFEKEFRSGFFKADTAFKMRDNEPELAILAGATLASIFKGKDNAIGDVAALATVCPCVQGKTTSAPVPDILDEAREYLVQRSTTLRKRDELQWKCISVPQLDDSMAAISDACKKNIASGLEEPFSILLKKLREALENVTQGINQVQHNHLLYREESDMLWWMQGRYSRDLQIPIDQINLPVASLVAGKELADLVRVIPGPFSVKAILYQMLSKEGSDVDSEVTLSSVINEADRNWRETWNQSYSKSEAIDLCPILFAVKKSLETDGDKNWPDAFKKVIGLPSNVKINTIDIAMQTYEECLFIKSYERD